MKVALTWTVVHLATWALIYAAFLLNSAGALSVLKFFVWMLAPFAIGFLLTKTQESLAKEPARPGRQAANRLQAWALLILLVWFGHIVTGVAWAWVMLCSFVAREGAKAIRAKQVAA